MAYSIDELICEVEESSDGIAQLEEIISHCQAKIASIQAWIICEGPDYCDAHHPCKKHAAEANAGRFKQR